MVSEQQNEGGPPLEEKHYTICTITQCPTVTAHCGKRYKALLDSGAGISLVRYDLYEQIPEKLKTSQAASPVKLSTADGSEMTTLGYTKLKLRIADFSFHHYFIVCDSLPDAEILLGIDVQRKYAFNHTRDKDRNCYIQRDGKFLAYTLNTTPRTNNARVKSTLKIPPRHNGRVPVKITGHTIHGIPRTS